jgi:hypothetical protein
MGRFFSVRFKFLAAFWSFGGLFFVSDQRKTIVKHLFHEIFHERWRFWPRLFVWSDGRGAISIFLPESVGNNRSNSVAASFFA